MLQSFANSTWGSPESPNCRGFTPEEFQGLRLEDMDFSDYATYINDKLNQMSPLLQQYIGQVGTDTATAIGGTDAYQKAQ